MLVLGYAVGIRLGRCFCRKRWILCIVCVEMCKASAGCLKLAVAVLLRNFNLGIRCLCFNHQKLIWRWFNFMLKLFGVGVWRRFIYLSIWKALSACFVCFTTMEYKKLVLPTIACIAWYTTVLSVYQVNLKCRFPTDIRNRSLKSIFGYWFLKQQGKKQHTHTRIIFNVAVKLTPLWCFAVGK